MAPVGHIACSSSPQPRTSQSILGPRPRTPPSEPTPLVQTGPAETPLHPEQERVVRCIKEGSNVFYTGSAGTGKSTVLKAFVRRLKKLGKQVDIVAPSGIAAHNVGGSTIYNYAYWRPDTFKSSLRLMFSNANTHGKSVRRRLGRTDVLVIDEISMVERDMLVRLDAVMREVRAGWRDEDHPERKHRSPHDRLLPFGGAQIVVTGDFCQLPPVKPFQFCVLCGGDEPPGWEKRDGQPSQYPNCGVSNADADTWAFRSKSWETCNFKYFELKHIHRQSDQQFINILQKCRLGAGLSQYEKALLTAPKPDPPGAVKLLPSRREVYAENLRNFARLTSSPRAYRCLDFFHWANKNEPELRKKGQLKDDHRPDGPLLALKDHRFEENIQLKVGMLVILLVNLDFPAGLVNGSQGKIIRFEKYNPEVSLVPVPQNASPSKSDRRNSKRSGGNEVTMFKEAQIRNFMERAEIQEWPVVEFYNGQTRPIYASCQLSELGSEESYSRLGRTQIPLLAAWAITVHKSQGMTLDRVIVDLWNSFEREMVYVALSRARTLEGLKVIRLLNNMGRGINEEVQQFLNTHFGGQVEAPNPEPLTQQAKPSLLVNPAPAAPGIWEAWRMAVKAAFKDYATIRDFPAPPANNCGNIACQTDSTRRLEACPCNIEAAFARLKDLKKERRRWHPDRFSSCPLEDRGMFVKMAREVFVVVVAMWERAQKAKQQA